MGKYWSYFRWPNGGYFSEQERLLYSKNLGGKNFDKFDNLQ